MQQSSLDGFGTPHPTDSLFFAVFPPPEAAQRIGALAADLRGQLGLHGQPRPSPKLHVTLHHLGDFAGVPQQRVDEACTVADRVALPSFQARFNRVRSFHGRAAGHPLVLLGDETAAGMGGLHDSLGARLAAAGLVRRGPAFVPHVTLLYDARMVAEQPVEPLGWTVQEFVLINSLLGRKEYRVLGRWPLVGAG